ncbi:MAG: BON domain-containing protein [Polyangiaceae bacterium]
MTRTPLHALPLFATSLLVAACQPATRTPAPPPAVAGPTTPQAVAVPVVEAPPNDEAVARAAKRELATDPSVDEMAVSVVVVDGIVQLTGRVDTLLAKRRAEAIAESLRGVRAVSNRLHVDTIDVPALQLVTTIESAYALDPAAESYEIDVAASKGRVTLTGQVDSWPEKRLAVRIAEGVIGVRDVVDELEVRYDGDRADADIAADARARLDWDVLVDDGMVDVHVDDGVVHLSGTVGSAAEKSRAIGDAYVTGATKVDADGLAVEPWRDREHLRNRTHTPRSDEAIADAIEDAAVYDPRVHGSDVHARVAHGRVTLTGTVPTKRAKLAAGRMAENTVGVISMTNLIQVVPPTVVSEAKLSSRVDAALRLNPVTERNQIVATASGGEVTLSGTVDSHFEKAEAADVASGVAGVTEVSNLLRVREPLEPYVYNPRDRFYPLVDEWSIFVPREPRLPDDEIERAIERELFWEPYASSWQISVEVRNGVATLKGEVDSPAEAATAIANAFQAGAVRVEDELTVDPS